MMKKVGFILPLTLMMLSVSTIVVTQIFFQGHLYNLFVPIVLEKEKARHLALSGASIALSQLSLHDTRFVKAAEKKPGVPQEEKKDPRKEKAERSKNMLRTLLNVQGRWQNFVLSHDIDGIDAQISICITCEDGKLNVNKLYDFEKHEFVKVLNASTQELFAFLGNNGKQFTKNKNMFDEVEELLKKRETPFLEVTQLLQGKKLEEFKGHLFYTPVQDPVSEQARAAQPSKKERMPKIYLADLFTVATSSYRLNPWVLSPSLQLLFNIKPREVVNEKDFQKEIEELIEKVSLDTISWEKDWDTYLKPLYKIDFQSIPKEIQPFLSTKFEPRLFSVLCYGKVGRVTQKLLVLIERNAVPEGESISIKKMYWL